MNPPAPGSNVRITHYFAYLYKKTKETAQEFRRPRAVAFIAGDEYQSKAVDFVFDLLSPSSLKPRILVQGCHAPGKPSVLAVDALGPQQSLFAKQAQNTRYIFTLVRTIRKSSVSRSPVFSISRSSWTKRMA